jgi:hypothetical protein
MPRIPRRYVGTMTVQVWRLDADRSVNKRNANVSTNEQFLSPTLGRTARRISDGSAIRSEIGSRIRTMPDEQARLSGAYSTWLGRPVILRVATGELQTTLHCTVIGESDATVRIRIAGKLDVDICKELVLAVEAVQTE